MNIIEVQNLNYNTLNKELFKNISINIKEGSFTSIIGQNGVGKTTLLKLLSGSIITSNNVKIDNIKVNKFSIEEMMNKTAFITSNNEFFSKTVMNEILQDKKNVDIFDVNKVKRLLNDFNLSGIETLSPSKLSYAENQIVALIKAMIKKPRIIFLDNAFSRLDYDKRIELLKYVKDYSKEHNITVIMATNYMSDIHLSDQILFIKDKRIFFDGNYEDLMNNVDLDKEGLILPWEVEVSKKVMLYGLIDEVYDDMDKLVGELCR